MNVFRPAVGLIALMLSALACGADADQRWLTDDKGCKAVAPDKAKGIAVKLIWDGACVDGFVSGKGTLQMGPGTFTGEFKQGQILNGGKLVLDAATSYVGEFVDNMPAGRGVYKYAGVTVTGIFDKDGNAIGPALMEWPSGERYEGTFNKSKQPEGKGRLTFNAGYYEGEFLKGLRHGTGTIVNDAGFSYTGQWAYGEESGKGTAVYTNGARYEGEFKAGKREGQGRATDADGSIREGEWQDDELNGKCRIHEALGHDWQGTCVVGRLSGQGRSEDPADGSAYEGEFQEGLYHGQGRLTAEGYVYEGAFALGRKNGRGKEVFESGEQYEGEFVRNERTGHGVLRFAGPNGTALSYDGTFKGGLFAGPGKLTVDDSSFEGEFKDNMFVRGVVHTKQGKTLEVDAEKQTYFEVLKDGTKVPIDPRALAAPPKE